MKKSAIALIIVGILLLSVGGLMYYLYERDQATYEENEKLYKISVQTAPDSPLVIQMGQELQDQKDTQDLRKNLAMGGLGGGILLIIIGIALSGALADGEGGGGGVEKDLLYVIRAMTVLLGAGVGLESTMEHVAKSSYGQISFLFDKILGEAKKGEYIEDALQREANTTTHPAMRKMLNTMVLGSKGEIDLVEALSKIAEREMRDREMDIDKFIETLGTRSEIYMTMGILVPIIVVVVIFVQTLIGKMAGGGGESSSSDEGMDPRILGILLFANLAILAFIAAKTKLDEPQI